jgi:lipopolysaccharide transport system permease protein
MSILNYTRIGITEYIKAYLMKDTWLYLGIQDIKIRYRRSVLGPWWVTISTAIMIIALGFLWTNIFVTETKTYMPFFAVGYVIWTWISSQLADSVTGFIQFENTIKQTDLPFPIYIFRITIRNLIILIHNFVVVALVIIFIGNGFNENIIYAIPAIAVIQLLIVMLSTCVAIFCTRYRDMNQVIMVILQIAFFFSPILWQPSSLKGHKEIINYNPIYHWLEIIRQPLLGYQPSNISWIFVICNLISISLLCFYLLGKSRSKIAIWL